MRFNDTVNSILEGVDLPPPPPAIIQQAMSSKITFDDVFTLLKQHEGYKKTVYRDTRGKPTIGVGFNLSRQDAPKIIASIGADYDKIIHGAQELTDDQIMKLFQINIRTAYNDAKLFLPQFDGLPKNVKLAILDMSFNLGYPGLSKFKNTRQYIISGFYKKAGEEILNSKWAAQVKGRANNLAKLFFSS